MNNCKNCGGEVVFTPKVRGNTCANCGSVFATEYVYKFVKKPIAESYNLESSTYEKNSKSLKCDSCGATMVLNKLQTQSSCPYCGNTSVIESRRKKLMAIDSVIPFSFSKQEAFNKFKHTLHSKFYANTKPFRGISLKNVAGVYVNSFVFDMATTSSYSGVFSYTKTTKDKDGNTKHETVHKAVHGVHKGVFKNVTIESNSHIEQSDLYSIMPFNFASAVEFKEDFMNGYLLEYENTKFDDCVNKAERIVKNRIENELLREHNCDRIVSLTLNTNYVEKKYNYCLLPFYLFSNVYKNTKYTSLMNGQTGKVGKLPTNIWKVLLTVFLICGFIVGIILLVLFLR